MWSVGFSGSEQTVSGPQSIWDQRMSQHVFRLDHEDESQDLFAPRCFASSIRWDVMQENV